MELVKQALVGICCGRNHKAASSGAGGIRKPRHYEKIMNYYYCYAIW